MTIYPPSHLQYLREIKKYGKETGMPKSRIMEAWRNGLPKLKEQNFKSVAWESYLWFVENMSNKSWKNALEGKA